MKEIIEYEPIYLEEYDVNVKQYLSYAEIQNIVNTVIKLDSWAEREQTIDMMVLMYVTDIVPETLEKAGHESLLKCGLIEEVKDCVRNYSDINRAIGYTESTVRTLAQILKQVEGAIEPLKKAVAKNAKSK